MSMGCTKLANCCYEITSNITGVWYCTKYFLCMNGLWMQQSNTFLVTFKPEVDIVITNLKLLKVKSNKERNKTYPPSYKL